MPSIALIGYGRMGKAVERAALERGHRIIARIDQDTPEEWAKLKPGLVEAVIEFTHPDSFEENFHRVTELGIPLVSGTTGWYDKREQYAAKVDKREASFLFASNFSIGVNILFLLNKRLAELMDKQPQYDCFIEEQHHRFKADAPSGTAISLGEQILTHLDRKKKIADESLRSRAPQPEELSVAFSRSGGIIGKHVVHYTSEIDSVAISHTAHTRKGFALGAVIAAEWLIGKKGFYEFADIFDQLG